jgi:hypothetical protein
MAGAFREKGLPCDKRTIIPLALGLVVITAVRASFLIDGLTLATSLAVIFPRPGFLSDRLHILEGESLPINASGPLCLQFGIIDLAAHSWLDKDRCCRPLDLVRTKEPSSQSSSTVRDRTPCAPCMRTPSMSAVAEGPV